MNFENLKKMTPEQLAEVAGKCGVKFHPRAKAATIIKKIAENKDEIIRQIMESTLTSHKPKVELSDPRLATKKEPVFSTEEQVEQAIAHVKAKQPKFQTVYNHDEKTVTFQCLGAEECHNLSVPLRFLVKKAEIVARGRIALMGLNDHFDKTAATGLSAYTNTVLAG